MRRLHLKLSFLSPPDSIHPKIKSFTVQASGLDQLRHFVGFQQLHKGIFFLNQATLVLQICELGFSPGGKLYQELTPQKISNNTC